MKTEKELKQIAVDFAEGKIFSNLHIDMEIDGNMLAMVFMPLALGANISEQVESGECFMIYEYLSEAGPRSVNGMPIFFSMRYISKDEYIIMMQHYNNFVDMKNEFLSDENQLPKLPDIVEELKDEEPLDLNKQTDEKESI
jgi:hypothetical protein